MLLRALHYGQKVEFPTCSIPIGHVTFPVHMSGPITQDRQISYLWKMRLLLYPLLNMTGQEIHINKI